MGALVDSFKETCACCRQEAIPHLIRGRYKDGTRLVMSECPTCGYIVKQGYMDPLSKMQQLQSPEPTPDLEGCGGVTQLLLS